MSGQESEVFCSSEIGLGSTRTPQLPMKASGAGGWKYCQQFQRAEVFHFQRVGAVEIQGLGLDLVQVER